MPNELPTLEVYCADCDRVRPCRPYWVQAWYASLYLCDSCALERKENENESREKPAPVVQPEAPEYE